MQHHIVAAIGCAAGPTERYGIAQLFCQRFPICWIDACLGRSRLPHIACCGWNIRFLQADKCLHRCSQTPIGHITHPQYWELGFSDLLPPAIARQLSSIQPGKGRRGFYWGVQVNCDVVTKLGELILVMSLFGLNLHMGNAGQVLPQG